MSSANQTCPVLEERLGTFFGDSLSYFLSERRYLKKWLGFDIMNELSDADGIFISIYTGTTLRGCQGRMIVKNGLFRQIQSTLIRAAFMDRRFPPVTSSEISSLSFILEKVSKFKLVSVKSSDDFRFQLRDTGDGIVFRYGEYGTVVLPRKLCSLESEQDRLEYILNKSGLSIAKGICYDNVAVSRFTVLAVL
ncbi:AMMECR1 domain-containing protein [Bdellovibrionales bacterium]|nr:AMMECR1 domain-containing protein [Bdellovibrionales bacterium]